LNFRFEIALKCANLIRCCVVVEPIQTDCFQCSVKAENQKTQPQKMIPVNLFPSSQLSSSNDRVIFLIFSVFSLRSRYNLLSISTGYGLDSRGIGVRFPAGAKRFFSSCQLPDRLWGHPSPYPKGTRGLFPGVKLTIHLHLVPRSRRVELRVYLQ
jgi:hypothetical protein